jgi:hypothetical protein
MPITATFAADFSSFSTAVQKAEVELRSFEDGAGKIEKALGRIGDNFSGRKVIQEAQLTAKAIEDIGGVSRLTENELQRVATQAQEAVAKMKALGLEVPQGIQKIADAAKSTQSGFADLLGPLGQANNLLGLFGAGLSIGAVVAFGRSVLDTADSLTKMSDQTGIGIEALQRLQAVAEPSGNSLQDITSAVNQMQKRIVEGSQSAVDALSAIGVTTSELKALAPDDQFFRIAKGIQAIPDPARQAQAAMAIFGKSGAELLPTIKANIDALADSTVRMSAESAQALDDFGDAIGWAKSNAVAMLGDFAGSVLQLVGSLRQLPEEIHAWTAAMDEAAAKRGAWAWMFEGGQRLPDVSVPGMIGQAPGVPDSMQAQITAAQRLALIRGETAFAPGAPKQPQVASLPSMPSGLDDLLGQLSGGLSDQMEMIKAQAEWAAVMDELSSAAGNAAATVAGMNGEVVEGIKYYLQAGVSQGVLQKAYAATATEVAAVATVRVKEREALKLEQDAIAATARMWSEYGTVLAAQGSTAIDQQIAAINRWAAETAAAAQKAGTYTAEFADQLEATRKAKQAGVMTDFAAINDAMTTQTKAGLQQAADKAQATYQAALMHVGEFSDGAIQRFRDTADAAQLAANAFGTGFESASVRATAALQETVNQAAKAKAALDMMFAGDAVPTSESLSAAAMRPGSFLGFGGGTMQQGTTGFVSNLPWPARANGGPVSSGQPYMVGERGPELFTPGQSGFITPNGGGVGSITVNISAGVFDRSTVAVLADQIGTELLRRVNRRLPSA